MAYDKKGKAPKVKDRWYNDHKYMHGRDFQPREFKGKPQFTLDELYISPFTHVRRYSEEGVVTYLPVERIFIIAFFIGLYYDQEKPLVEDKAKRKGFGQAIMYWGNIEGRLGRNSYGRIREYMFAALIARTDIDFIALDKGEITPRKAVDMLIDKMEQYANFGFDYIQEKLEENPNHFFKESAFLRVFLEFLKKDEATEESDEDVPESLD